MTALIIVACVLAYLGGALLTARWRYAKVRPSTVPVACDSPGLHSRYGHHDFCYCRHRLIYTTGEALGSAFGFGLAWPVTALGYGALRIVVPVVTGGAKELPAEREARLERAEKRNAALEAENERLRHQQEGRLG